MQAWFMDSENMLLVITAGTFVLGWIVGRVGAAMKAGSGGKNRDPRDDRIRSLEAELRIASSEATKAKEKLAALEKDLEEARADIERRDNVITEQQSKVARLRDDLKDSVRKTIELREELTSRAEESLRSEVKLREVETELSVAQASTDLIATGVLDYNVAPDAATDYESSPKPIKSSG